MRLSFSVQRDVQEYKTKMRDIFVVDIQGFVDSGNRFLPKEVAVVSLQKGHLAHWIIAAPCKFYELSHTAQNQNNWLTVNFHGIEWSEGEIEYRQLEKLLCEIARSANYICVRGREKAQYLESVTSRKIFNLEGISPAFRKLPSSSEQCIHHGFVKRGIFTCALHNALKLKKWLCAQDKSFFDALTNSLTIEDRIRILSIFYDNSSEEEDQSYDTVDDDSFPN